MSLSKNELFRKTSIRIVEPLLQDRVVYKQNIDSIHFPHITISRPTTSRSQLKTLHMCLSGFHRRPPAGPNRRLSYPTASRGFLSLCDMDPEYTR